MYTVLLTDDEAAILESLSIGIPWQQFGVHSLLTASDGCQALEIMAAQKVDLLITDIRMPHMDGLSLLHQVRTLYPDTHCILLTAYGEFEYARTAMKLGVENYLLKPFQKEEMEETIETALNNIYISRKNSRKLFRSNILQRWVNGSIKSEELSERATLLDINIYLLQYCVACVCKRPSSGSLSAYCASCLDQLSSLYETHRFLDDKGRNVFIIGGKQILTAQLTNLFTSLSGNLPPDSMPVISIGSTVQEADSLAESYQSACSLIETADLTAKKLLILMPEQTVDHEEDTLIQELNFIFHQQDETFRYEEYHTLTSKLFDLTEMQSVDQVITRLTHSLLRLFTQEFPNQPGVQEQIYSRVRLFSSSSGQEAFTASAIELLEYSYLLFCYYFQQLSPVIQSSISYIHKHYAESISIKEFCVKNKMSTTYLGYLFKKETGLFFNNYMTQYRICCSIKLLRDSDLRINDIAQNVGFASTSYYIACFKKQTGLSPIKYRSLQD